VTGSASKGSSASKGGGLSKGSSLRDFQRSRVYDAEHLVHRIFDRSVEYPVIEVAGSHLTLPVERKFGSIEAVASYVEQVLALGWVRATWDRARRPVVVRERAGAGQAHYERAGSIMAVPGHRVGSGWALRELVILHELAHHLAESVEIAHGGAFVDRLLTLVDGVVGPEAALLLRVTMLDVGGVIG
jgi:putative metallohydrolase (TIGR04338 family)